MSKQQIEMELLVLAAQSGNEQAYRLLFQRINKGVVMFAAKLCGNSELAADAVQEAWLEVTRDIRKLDDPRAFRSWLYKKVRWRVTDLCKKSSKLLLEPMPEEATAEPESGVNESSSLSRELRKLPPLEQEMMHLFYVEDMKIKEISQVVMVPEGTVKSRLNRARAMLKAKLEQNQPEGD